EAMPQIEKGRCFAPSNHNKNFEIGALFSNID
ncbi:MAG: hypothetical protein QOK44_3710, partial [Betaproteobacteria bacterium]|nr:hypothetical protein [Betaproteobacteria bacterium]